MISVELSGDSTGEFDPEFVKHATNAVFHYFKHELGRQTITVGEFAGALEKVLRGFDFDAASRPEPRPASPVLESDLRLLAGESGNNCELFFFSRLRDELRHQLQQNPENSAVSRIARLRQAVDRGAALVAPAAATCTTRSSITCAAACGLNPAGKTALC